jgi:hypothetical protein
MKVTDLIESVKSGDPELLAGIAPEKAEGLVLSVFRHIQQSLDRTSEGVLSYAGLGRFRVRQLQKEVEGKSVTRTQIVFRRAEGEEEAPRGREGRAGAGALTPEQRKARQEKRRQKGK